MNVGLIISFKTFKNEALKTRFIKTFDKMTKVKVCLVCNSSCEQVYEDLYDISLNFENINVVCTKTNKSSLLVKAGARFLTNQYNLKQLGFIVDLDDFEILEMILAYQKYTHEIQALNKAQKESNTLKHSFYQSLFSIPEYLDKITQGSICKQF